MDCSNMNQRRCGCNCGCGCRPQMMIQPDFDCGCGEPPTMIPDRPVIEPRRVERPAASCGCAEGGTLMPNRPMPMPKPCCEAVMPERPMPMPKPCCNATMPAQTRCDCPNTGVGGMEMYPIAMGYIPWQQWQQTCALDRGLARGTIFPELDLPFVMGRCR
ncbi:MAG: spore coat associated protein CotJA [Hungatella hathewayi]